MSNLWKSIKAKELGFPSLPVEANPVLQGRCVAWIPGMKAKDTADWYFIVWHTGDLRRFREAGGDMEQAVLHHLSYDSGVIDPLWGRDSFKARVEKMRAFGIRYVVGPDFSSWADMPIVAQLHNYYKSHVVACDLARAGFRVIPNVCWSAPQVAKLAVEAWPADLKTVVVDASHINTSNLAFNKEIFWNGVTYFKAHYQPAMSVILWGNSQAVAAQWRRDAGECVWCPTRASSLGKLSKIRRQNVLQNKQCAR